MRSTRLICGLGGFVAITVALGVAVGACSAAGDTTGRTSSNGSGGNGNGGGEGGGFIPSSSSGGFGGNSACAATVIKAQPLPLGMYLMIDKSGSMQGANWTAVTNALKTFVDQPSTAGIGVGLQYFPQPSESSCGTSVCNVDGDCGDSWCGPCMRPDPNFLGTCSGALGSSCKVATYATPAVPIQNLPGIAPIVKNSLDMTVPDGGTPTSAALDGAITYMKQWLTTNPKAEGLVVLATDGDPGDCYTDLDLINAMAAAGLEGTPSVKTYVIGVGTQLTALNALALAGGTGQAYLVDTGGGVQAQFLQAMNEIRKSTFSCAYLIPQPANGEMVNYGAVNLQYASGMGKPEVIPQVSSLAGCPSDGKAWYYDNNDPPQQILLCPATCAAIAADVIAKVDVLVGCDTIVK